MGSGDIPESEVRKGLRKDFLFGFATAAAQIEAGGEEKEIASGKGPSIWDVFCAKPGSVEDGSSTLRTCNHLEKFREDIAMMKSLGVNSYRFSISWPRIIPLGGRDDPINEKGIKFYNDVLDECVRNGIEPFVTLYHWDIPATLDDRYGAWLNKDEVVQDYLRYAKLCFEEFGDRVKYWLTFNEPWCIAVLGYGVGRFAPGHQSNTEPWIVGHNVLVAHAHACRAYNQDFKPAQHGIIGITLNGDWAQPYDHTPENVKAAQDKMDVAVGWFADPIYLGDYPDSMRKMLGKRLPSFSAEEKQLLHHSSDFHGMNFYTTHLIRGGCQDEFNGMGEQLFVGPDGKAIAEESELPWLRDVPWGMRLMLNYLYQRYKMPIYMTENGFAPKGEGSLPVAEAIHDTQRVEYYRGYLKGLLEAVEIDGVDVRSYFGWSMMDNFEWDSGLGPRFGCVHVDYQTFKRTPKDSSAFLVKFFQENIGQSRSVKKS